MKLPEQPSNFNALDLVLKILPHKEPRLLTHQTLKEISGALAMGKIECDSIEEVVKCLEVLKDMNILDIKYNKDNRGTTLMIGNKYNGA